MQTLTTKSLKSILSITPTTPKDWEDLMLFGYFHAVLCEWFDGHAQPLSENFSVDDFDWKQQESARAIVKHFFFCIEEREEDIFSPEEYNFILDNIVNFGKLLWVVKNQPKPIQSLDQLCLSSNYELDGFEVPQAIETKFLALIQAEFEPNSVYFGAYRLLYFSGSGLKKKSTGESFLYSNL